MVNNRLSEIDTLDGVHSGDESAHDVSCQLTGKFLSSRWVVTGNLGLS